MNAIYRVDGAIAATSPAAGGPWDPGLQHGAAPSSLICWAVERLPSPVPMRVVRLTVDLMRPVPVAPLEIRTAIVREGRKIQLVEVALLADGKEVVRGSVLRMRIEARDMPAIAAGPRIELPLPEASAPPDFFATETPFLQGIEMKTAKGGFRIPGPAAIWYRATRPIVEGADISPLMRAVIAADFCNGTSSVFSMKDWTFINADLSVSLGREPVGDWILLDAETWAGGDSVGIAAARLADRQGYFGRAVQSVLFEKR